MVKPVLSALVLVCCLGGMHAAAAAVEPAPGAAAVEPAPGAAAVEPADFDGPAAVDQKKRGKGSGFWTSDVPTEDRPYRWTYMIIGVSVMCFMGVLVFWLIRRHAGTGTARPGA